MGMYTEIFFRANLSSDVPAEVVDILRVIIDGDERPSTLPKHPLFDCHRWELLGNCSSAYFPNPAESRIEKSGWGKFLAVTINANLKNYDNEIENFFDWINPYVDASPGEFIGYELYEDVEPGTAPTPYFKQEN